MKNITYIILSFITLLVLTSCSSSKKDPLKFQGQVKYETLSISSKLGGRIQKIYVNEGQTVKKGDTLAQINIPEVDAKLIQANGAILAARGQLEMAYNGATEEQLKQIEGKINAAKAQLDFSKNSYNRLTEMFRDSLISRQKLEEVGMKLNMVKAQLNALEAKKDEVKNGARKEQLQQAKGQLERALGVKQEVLTAAQEKYLVAPSDMIIETIALNEGELLTPGYTLISGYKKDAIYFRFTVNESDVYQFKVNQKITLVNPFTKNEIIAKIIAIKPLAKYANRTSSYPKDTIDQSVYELKIVPLENSNTEQLFNNAKMLISQ